MAEIDNDETQRAADDLHQALMRVMATAPEWVMEHADRDYTDEDWVRDAVRALKGYGTWRLSGESGFIFLAPGLDAGRAHADQMADAARYLSRSGDYIEGWSIPEEERSELRRAARCYESLRALEGGGAFG